MAGKTQLPWPEDGAFLRMVENRGPQKTAERLGCSRSAVQHRARKVRARTGIPQSEAQVEHEGVQHFADGSAVLTSPPVEATPWTREGLLEHFKFPAEEWEVTNAKVNIWGDPEDPRYQLKLSVVPIGGLISIPDPANWKPPPKPKKPRADKARKVVLVSDQHAPHHDRQLHAFFVRWLADNEPDEGFLMGDLLDFASISRHRERDGWCQPVNEGLQAAFEILYDYRHASPKTRWRMIRGNHDSRLEHAVLDNVRGLHRITAADDHIPALSLRRLLHLDDLHIEFIDEDWDRARVSVTSKLTVRHGPATGKQATDKLLSKYARSTLQGHTHRLSLKFRTEHTEDEDEPTITRLGGEVGCMCEIKDSLGYGSDEDWQQGFMAGTVWPDGDFHLTPCTYIPGRLLTPGKRYV